MIVEFLNREFEADEDEANNRKSSLISISANLIELFDH